jgi:hypothetical protein
MTECKYPEIWLSNLEGKFRVSSRLPPPAQVPEDFGCLTPEGETMPICVSPLYDSIHDAKGRAAALQADLQAQGCKVLFFFELRPAVVGDPHTIS